MEIVLKVLMIALLISCISEDGNRNSKQSKIIFNYSLLSKTQLKGKNIYDNGMTLVDSMYVFKGRKLVNNIYTYKMNSDKIDIKLFIGWSRKDWYRNIIEISNRRFSIDSLWYGNSF